MRYEETNYYESERALREEVFKNARNTRVICLENNRLLNFSFQLGILMGHLERKIKKVSTFFKFERIKGRVMK